MLSRLKDKQFRRRFILTLAVCWSYMMLAWVVLQAGMALPDLMALTDVTLEAASWYFTTRSMGFVLGCMLSGFLFDRCNRLLIMVGCSLGMAACSLVTPYMPAFTPMVLLRIVLGIFCGGIDTGANTIVPSVWGTEASSFMQALYFSYTLGGIMSPFATEPFMAPKRLPEEDLRAPATNLTLALNLTDVNNMNRSFSDSGWLNITNDEAGIYTSTSAHIHIAYIITCALTGLSSIPYIVMFLNGFNAGKSDSEKDEMERHELEKMQTEEPEKDLNETTTKWTSNQGLAGMRKYIVLFCVGMMNLLYGAAEDSLGSFIATFCIDFLDWTNMDAATLNSLYWVTSAVGGLSGICLVRVMHTCTLLYVTVISWTLTFVGALLAGLYRIDALVWICVPASGFFMVQIVPASISWVEENVCRVNGKIAAMIIMFTGTGLACNPSFLGYMMEKYSYMQFLYVLVIEACICFLFLISAHLLTRNHKRQRENIDIVIGELNGDICVPSTSC